MMDLADLRRTIITKLRAHGLAGADAEALADLALDAEMRGKGAHGLRTLRELVATLPARRGRECRVVTDHGVLLLLDASERPGPLAAREAVRHATQRAREHGIALVGATATGPVGALAGYADPTNGLVTLLMASTPLAVVPPGGSEPLLGTNPLCLSAPGPVVIDFATADLPFRHLMLARERGTPLPEGKAVDRDGRPTTDAREARGLLAFGDHRGAALGLVVEILAASLLGVHGKGVGFEPAHFSLLILAIDPDRLGSRGCLEQAVQEIMKAHPRVPGDEARKKRERALADGAMEIPEDTLRLLDEL